MGISNVPQKSRPGALLFSKRTVDQPAWHIASVAAKVGSGPPPGERSSLGDFWGMVVVCLSEGALATETRV